MVLADVVEEHVEEIALLWLRRSVLSTHPSQNLETLSELDGRIGAHLDGVRVDPAIAWMAAERLFKFEDVGEIFSMACVALENGGAARFDIVLNAVVADHALAEGLIAALGWLSYPRAQPYIDTLLKYALPAQRRMGIAACVLHRVDPGEALYAALQNDDAALRVRACHAVGELGRRDLLVQLHMQFQSEDEAVSFWSCWSAALLGDIAPIPVLKRFATLSAYAEEALSIVLPRLPVQPAQTWIEALAQDETNARLVVRAVSTIGDPAFVPGLIRMMSVQALARIAADAFCSITGANLADEKLEAIPATPVNEEDEALVGSDELLPWPDVSRISAWWDQNQARYKSGTRYLLGKPVTPEQLQWVLRHGNQQLRYGAALELSMLRPGVSLFNIAAPAQRQIELLSRLS